MAAAEVAAAPEVVAARGVDPAVTGQGRGVDHDSAAGARAGEVVVGRSSVAILAAGEHVAAKDDVVRSEEDRAATVAPPTRGAGAVVATAAARKGRQVDAVVEVAQASGARIAASTLTAVATAVVLARRGDPSRRLAAR